jgi:integrase/recombinase XerD
MILWRRHVAPCDSIDPTDPRCGCPIYQEYRVGRKRFRRSLKTRNWQKALAEARQKELEGFKEKPKSPMIEQACDKYLDDVKARDLREPTIYKFKLLFRQLKEFALEKGLVFISDFDLDSLRQFRATWPNKNEAARVKLGNLKAFFRFCSESKWTEDNPATKLKAGKVVEQSIVPITEEEFVRILKACDEHSNKKNRMRLRAFVLLMYYSALAVRDTVTLRRDAINNGKLFLRRTKTGTDVLCPLPGEVLKALKAIGSQNEYFFWSGKSKPKSAVGDYQRALTSVFEEAKTPRVFSHLFRHTCITNWLSAGVPVESVAVLAGHSSIRITMKHYSHWIKSRQDNLETEVKKSWAQLGTVSGKSDELLS